MKTHAEKVEAETQKGKTMVFSFKTKLGNKTLSITIEGWQHCLILALGLWVESMDFGFGGSIKRSHTTDATRN